MSSSLRCVTLTGIDEQLDQRAAFGLSERFPLLEWGILLGGTPTPRYPSIDFICHWRDECKAAGARTALHLCGKFARRWIEGDPDIVDLTRGFDRIQVNVVADRIDSDALVHAVRERRHPSIITQHNEANEALTGLLMDQPHHAILFDASGGRGVGPDKWPNALAGKACGFAGGLGPDNVGAELDKIQAAAGSAAYWIDMEGQLRTPQDTLDLARCVEVLSAVDEWVSQPRAAPPPRPTP